MVSSSAGGQERPAMSQGEERVLLRFLLALQRIGWRCCYVTDSQGQVELATGNVDVVIEQIRRAGSSVVLFRKNVNPMLQRTAVAYVSLGRKEDGSKVISQCSTWDDVLAAYREVFGEERAIEEPA